MPPKRPKIPILRNRPLEAKRRRERVQTNLHAASNKTGIIHTFGNIEGWENAMAAFEARKNAQLAQLYSVIPFYSWLKNQVIDKSNCNQPFDVGFRFANPVYGPLTIVGSISDGGRFNIGGAQLDPNFPNLTKAGALYLASTEECAREEASKPIGKHQLYKLRANKSLILWDLKKVIEDLKYTNLMELVKADHGEKIWAYQKFPTVSQILASQLRSLGGDGLIFESTKNKGRFNIALFFVDDDSVKQIMTIQS